MEDDQQFCLRWNNHQSTIIQNFDTLLESGTLVDCTLAAEGKYLKAHKVVLSACSPYFEGLLSEHYDKHPVFILKDVKFKELKAMMDYMYRGEVNISQDQLTALLKAAESLQIKGLSDSRTDKGTGNTGNTTTGGSKDNTRPAKTASSTAAASASAAAVDIPHTSSGLTIEKNSKVPRQSIQQVSVSDQLENSASPQLRGHSSREGSQSPTRKRKRLRRRSLGNDDNSMENHEASNSSDVNMTAPALGVAPVAEEKSQADPADSIGRSALMQQLTKPADEMLQMPLEKPEPSEDMIQPKSEYQDDQESVEDLTNFDDDMNDLNEMEQDNSRAGPSHDPSQHAGMPSWHIAGDRSNASVVGAAAGPGAGDEVFLAAAEAAQAQRDSQETSLNPRPFLAIREIRSLRPSADYNPFAKRKTKYNKHRESDEDFIIDDDYNDDEDDSDYDDEDHKDNIKNYSNQAFEDPRLMPFGLNITGNRSDYTPDQLDFISMTMNRKLKKLESFKLINFYCPNCNKSQPRSCTDGSAIKFCSSCGQQLRYQCSRCPDKVYSVLASAQRHVHGECVNPIKLSCFFCDYQTARKYRLITHIRNKHSHENQEQPMKKKRIKKTTFKRWKLGRKCKICKQKFKTVVWYQKHVKKCQAEKNVIAIKSEAIDEVEEVQDVE
ncbi:longitudinals lacking protein, isoforms H/M/V isoform X14 [Nasonia vitripennis]|uniref:BTB domain-containing protein n=1 Tax=Nasonia vitripennis TaxID=7425 RepID=A0A7M7QGD6_NASVI|nr:longitudinals lacking protein, isoforms H/M/V isoform X14 [Nasonia vitripennis]XP_032456426.1 longitudinals lacking protein, isoforms H/M/V isoform X14 [Nasonia vitripennis]